MTGFCVIYRERRLGHTMKFMLFPISDAWLVKVVTCVILYLYGIFSPSNPQFSPPESFL